MTNISLVVVHFNQTKTTINCLRSLSQLKTQRDFSLKILVVDNGSTQKFKLPKIFSSNKFVLIRSDANLGFTGGNNLGIHYAVERFDPAYVWLINNDTTFDANCLLKLYQFSQKHPEFGIVSPKIYFSPGREFHHASYSSSKRGKIIWYVGGAIDWRNLTAFHLGVDEVDRGQFEGQINTEFISGCALFIRRETLEKIGYLDKRYFLYFEDVDWSLKAKKHGYQLGICHNAIMWHQNAGSSGGAGSNTHVYYQERNRYLLAWLHGDWRAKLVMMRLQLNAILSGNRFACQAVFDFYRRRFGKQVYI